MIDHNSSTPDAAKVGMPQVVACTVVTKSHLAYARALAASLYEHNPGSKLYVLLADRLDASVDPAKEPFDLVRLDDLPDVETVRQMCFYYTPFELCCALRGMLHAYMQENTSFDSWMFLDSDIMVFHSLEGVVRELEKTSILLSPHCAKPVPHEHVQASEIVFLKLGLYNAGFVGLRRTSTSRAFISWFEDRLRGSGFFDLSSAQNCDQLWLNFVPVFFRDVAFLSHPGANVAYWNLHERKLAEDPSGRVTVNGEPLLFFHFSGMDMAGAASLTKHPMIADGVDFAVTAKLVSRYRSALLANGYAETRRLPYGFARFDCGRNITPADRRLYFQELVSGSSPSGSPFANSSYYRQRSRQLKMAAATRSIRRLGGRLARRLGS